MECWHMSGAGNDFMVLDARGKVFDFESLSRTLCAQFGTDGFMAVDVSSVADFKLHFYNPDGSRGEMCGNGARCICKFACDRGIAGKAMVIETDAGPVYGWRLSDTQYKVQLNNPSVIDYHCKDNGVYVELGDPGIPHSVTHCPDLRWEDREVLLPAFLSYRNATEYPKGVNVNFYRWIDDTTIRILTFERGVEDYTLACGTGSASVAAVLWLEGKLPDGKLAALNPGGRLDISIQGQNGVIDKLFLEGPAELLHIYEI